MTSRRGLLSVGTTTAGLLVATLALGERKVEDIVGLSPLPQAGGGPRPATTILGGPTVGAPTVGAPTNATLGGAQKSVRVPLEGQHLFSSPDDRSARRGAARRDALLPLFGERWGPGCKRAWLSVGPSAWVCEDAVERSALPPLAAGARPPDALDGLPYRYHFVGRDGSFAYKRLDRADAGEPDVQLEPGFSVAIVEERSAWGSRYGRTAKDLWVPMRDLAPARPFLFQGKVVAEGEEGLSFGWVVAELSRVRDAAGLLRASGSKQRFDFVPVLEQKGKLVRIGDGEWLPASEVRVPTRAAPPDEVDVKLGERWVDVELATQTLVAYEGARPVFATLVSTGKGRQGSATATPKGVARVWIKLLTSDMDNLEDDHASRYYRMEDVPFVQYFSKGVGLHAAYWHRSFGQVRSHGCVNLAPLDAQRLFWWSAPHLPAGWSAAAPTRHERGMVVRVR